MARAGLALIPGPALAFERYSGALTGTDPSPPARSQLARKLGLAVALLVATFAAGGAFIAYVAYGRREAESTGRSVTALAAAIAGSYEVYDASFRRHPAASIAESLATRTDIARIEIRGHDGVARWTSRPEPASLLANELVLPVAKHERCAGCHESEPNPIGQIRIATSQTVPFGGVSPEALSILGLGSALLIVFVLILVERLALVRIERLVRVLDQVEGGDFMTRADVDSNDEIGRMAQAVNRLLAKITDLRVEGIESQRELTEVEEELALKTEIEEKTQALLEAHNRAEHANELYAAANEKLSLANQELARRFDRLRFLYEVSRRLRANSATDPTEALGSLAALVHETLGVPETSVLLLDHGGVVLTRAFGFAPGALTTGQRLEVQGTISGEAIESKAPVYVPDLARTHRRVAYRKDAKGSLLCVPVIVQDRLAALLHFSSSRIDAFSEDERELLVSLGSQAALAAANADLRARLEANQAKGELEKKPLIVDRQIDRHVDETTGLPNRQAILETLERAAQGPVSVVMFDVPGLRTVTELLGAPAADEILKGLADFLKATLPPETPVGRYGVDQFLIVLNRINAQEAKALAEKLERSVLEAQAETGVTEPVAVVAGSAALKVDTDAWSELPMRAALAARKDAAESGFSDESGEDLPEVEAVLVQPGEG
ncbi:MAG: diguanylate cyclase [Deltaproteobacteria bacterium]|nr:diguanylate cyclase [Deltaproteobacteria bacterium]